MDFDCRKRTNMLVRVEPGDVHVEQHLIITADDFGYSVTRNTGIIECYTAGGITRASLMVNGVACKEAVETASLHGLPIGRNLHYYKIHTM